MVTITPTERTELDAMNTTTAPTDAGLIRERMTDRERTTLRETAELLIEAHGPDGIPLWELTQTAAELFDTDETDPQMPAMRRVLAAELRRILD